MTQRLLSVVLIATVLLAGCVGGPGQSPSTSDQDPPSETDSPTTDVQTPGENATVDWPEGPKTQPAVPDALSIDSVREFVKTHEYRYVYNSLWGSQYSDVSVDCSVEEVGPAGNGYEGVVSCSGYSTTQGPATGNQTATVVHGDWFTQTYVYYVDEDSLRRTRADE